MSHRIPQAILLDMDDTLVDFSSGADPSWHTACIQYAVEIGGHSTNELHQAIMRRRKWYWDDEERHRRGRLDPEHAAQAIVTRALLDLGVAAPALATRLAHTYLEMRTRSLRLFPNTLNVLQWLRSLGVRLALITNGRAEDQRGKIDRFQLEPLFDYILIEGEFGVGKPDYRVYHHALNQLRLTATDSWMVGDNLEGDVAAPQRLGLTGIWYDVAGKGLPASSIVRPDHVIHRISELQDLIDPDVHTDVPPDQRR